MKKLIIIPLLFLSVLVFGQNMRSPFARAAAVAGEPSAYTEQYQAVLDVWTTDPTGDTLTWQNNLVYSLDTAGFWDNGDLLYIPAITENGDGEATVNWLNPGTYDLTETNSPTWTDNEGYTGNGTNSYLTTGWDVANNGVNYTQNDASICVYIRNNVGVAAAVIGSEIASGGSYLYPRTATGYVAIRLNSNNESFNENTNSQGFWQVSRGASDDVKVYKNASLIWNPDPASTTPSSEDLKILTGDATAFSTCQVAFVYIGKSLTPTKIGTLNTIVETYMDAIGKGVIE